MSIFDRLKNHIGLLPNPISRQTRQAHARIKGAAVHVSVCPYCAVGCSQLVYAKDGRIVDIEGNYDSPINGGTLCPKGAATFSLINNPTASRTSSTARPTATTGRSARSTGRWSASPSWSSRRATPPSSETRRATARRVNRTLAIGHLGGATLDNEENYLIKKLFTAGLGSSPSRTRPAYDTARTVPGLGARLGRGGATTYQQDLANSDCIVIMGSNMAENHPVGFRFVVAGEGARRHRHPRRPALHPHLGAGRHPRPAAGRQRHRLPRRR